MKNEQKFANGTQVYHWDLFCGWNEVEVLSYNAEEDEYTLRENDLEFPFDFTDSAQFVHETPINDIAERLVITPKG